MIALLRIYNLFLYRLSIINTGQVCSWVTYPILYKYDCHFNWTRNPNTYSISKLVAIINWIKRLSLKGFCQLIPFCKTVTQMNGLNMMWIQIKTTAVGDIANFLLYHRAVGTSGPIPPWFWQEWKENLPLYKVLNNYSGLW